MIEISISSSSGKIMIMVGVVVGLLGIVGFRFFSPKPPRIESHQSSPPSKPVENDQGRIGDQARKTVSPAPTELPVAKSIVALSPQDTLREAVNPQEQAPSIPTPPQHRVSSEIREMNKIVYTIKFLPSKTVMLETWEEAKNELESASKDLSHVSVAFDSQVILQHRKLSEFEQWVSRLNDYVFLQRMLLIRDMSKVIRNAELTRGSMANCKTTGCVLLDAESETWTLTIKGLGEYPDILSNVFEQVINPALAEPSIIATCDEVACIKMSVLLGDKITKNQAITIDKMLTSFTSDQDMVKARKDNLVAFIPCASWHEIKNIDEPAKQKICTKRQGFLGYIMEEVVSKKIPDEKPTSESVHKVVDTSYRPVMVQLKKFIKETNLADIVKSSLLNKAANEKN